MKRMVGTLALVVCITSSACSGSATARKREPTETTVYDGTAEMRHQTIGADAKAGTFEVTTAPVRVEIGPPLAAEGDGEEKNPFHLVVGTPVGSHGTIDGSVYVTSSFAAPNDPPPPTRVIVDDWSYSGSLDSFKGSLTRLLSHDVTNYVTTRDDSDSLGGPTICAATMKRGATLEGSVSGDTVRIQVSGAGGGYNLGATCLSEITFEVNITAKRTGTRQTPAQ